MTPRLYQAEDCGARFRKRGGRRADVTRLCAGQRALQTGEHEAAADQPDSARRSRPSPRCQTKPAWSARPRKAHAAHDQSAMQEGAQSAAKRSVAPLEGRPLFFEASGSSRDGTSAILVKKDRQGKREAPRLPQWAATADEEMAGAMKRTRASSNSRGAWPPPAKSFGLSGETASATRSDMSRRSEAAVIDHGRRGKVAAYPSSRWARGG